MDTSKKALIAWEQVCRPRTTRGLNILDAQTWNKAAISKLLWNLCVKKYRLWVKWVHQYYGKQGTLWGVEAPQASWMVRKILQMHQELETIGWNEMYIKQMDRFSIKKLYKALMGEYQKVEWRRLICNNVACPKWNFILYLALEKRLLTRDRLAAWGVWQKILHWLNIQREARRWDEEVLWANTHCKEKQARAKVYRMAVAASVYVVWQERNQCIFKQIIRTPGMLVRKIVQEVHLRGRKWARLDQVLQSLNAYPV
ncbi:uncharacterized protein LOC125830123 [Solanum verrucosum]|uniref:uncharacterized protein LOC125830123 n=1 Tax=Solanum verrucosum TaxID=315347 RepID=UPI0020D0AEB5|nr:uncharacterized protein LOC125830123 [Solanum verrucosum]